jgi:hypothetical protein
MHFLLAGRASWRRVIRPALVTGLLSQLLGVFSSIYFSSTIIEDSGLYRPIGVVFTLLTWFMLIGGVIVLGAACGKCRRSGENSRSALIPKLAPADVAGEPTNAADSSHVTAAAERAPLGPCCRGLAAGRCPITLNNSSRGDPCPKGRVTLFRSL